MKEGACRREITEVFDLSQSDGGDWVEDALMFCPRLWKCQAGSWGTGPGGAPSWGPWWFPESTQRRRGGQLRGPAAEEQPGFVSASGHYLLCMGTSAPQEENADSPL